MKLRDILSVCTPDWIEIDRKVIDVNKCGIPEGAYDLEVKHISGFDDGLTIEVLHGSDPCTCLSVRKGRKL